MYRLGRIYATGSGVERDYVEAFNWYKRAAKAGNTDAMYALGEAYEHGTGVRDDIQQAVNWYDRRHFAAIKRPRPPCSASAKTSTAKPCSFSHRLPAPAGFPAPHAGRTPATADS